MQKAILLTGIIILCLSTNLYASKKVEGYYVRLNSTKKIKATFLVPVGLLASEPNFEKMQNKVLEVVEDREYPLTPDEISEISFTYKGKSMLMRSVFNNLARHGNGDLVFFNVVVDGPVSLYNYYESHMTTSYNPASGAPSGGMQTAMRLVLQREGSELVHIRRFYFRKDLADFFSDCTELVEKIESGQLTDLAVIVTQYNETCLTTD
jgi:hypothetical protein